MIKCGKFLTIKKEGSANQSEGCDARRKARYGPPAALCEGKHPLKYKTQSVVPAIWLVRRFFLFVWVLFVEKLGVLMTDKGGFL